MTTWSEALRLAPLGVVSEAGTALTPNVDAKAAGQKLFDASVGELELLQEKLFAHSTGGGRESVLLLLQGMDTAGKGGTVKRVMAQMNPQGIVYAAFKKPTPEELEHDFLWRIRPRVPAPGQIGIFDRSHYEDVLVPAVQHTLDQSALEARYEDINAFEQELVDSGVTLVKVFLHLGKEEQLARLLSRLDRPEKHWKFTEADVRSRGDWAALQRAYSDALTATNTDAAPWFVVPADRKWYSSLAVQQLLLERMRPLDLTWPPADYDVDEQRRLLLAT
ncbi:polyphosphate kinase 2 family protein [Humibacter sp. BT305]|nr:polyphosphate kinase 2 family protein [Humibacter sp. BT305]